MAPIPTRIHGTIDYTVAALLAGFAVAGGLPRPARAALGAASLYHTAYSAVTDYEAGLVPLLGMRRHLALDALGGAALVGAGLLMRRQPLRARLLLAGIGLAELAVTALSSDRPVHGPAMTRDAPEVGYPPLDTPKSVADGIWVVDSLLPGLLGRVLPVRMTVVRLPDGGLLLHSPTRWSPALQAALAALGPVRHLLAPNLAHWTFIRGWQLACPGAVTWAAPGLRGRRQVRRSGLRIDHELRDVPPAAWGDAIELASVPGGLGLREVAVFHRPSATLLLTDLVLNLDPHHVPAPLRPLLRLLGVTAPDALPPPYLRAVFKLRHRNAARAASRLLELRPSRVIFAHGDWFEDDATARLRHSLRWLLD